MDTADLDVLNVAPGTSPETLLDKAADAYWTHVPDVQLTVFDHHGATFLFDATAERDRTVMAIRKTETPDVARDVTYQRGYPLPDRPGGRRQDRGHFIPYTAGGTFGPNLYVQDRALNRGWSREGRRYRALESMAANTPGVTMAVHATYIDESAVPAFVQLIVFTSQTVVSDVFRNRFDDAALAGTDLLDVTLAGATDAQIGALGEETVAVLLEEEMGATIVALGDAGLERAGGRQDLDIVAIVGDRLVAFEVKTRHAAARAGRLTRAGNLPRPRLRHRSNTHRQASQPYVADRMDAIVDTESEYEGIDVQIVAVDLVAMLAQFFGADDHARRILPLAPPVPCRAAAAIALDRILEHRGYL